MSIRPILRFAAPLPRIENYHRYLFIGPHPDDIEIGAGASAARFAAEGKEVCFLVCADGRYGTDNLDRVVSPDELSRLRRCEAEASAALLGVKDLRFLDFCDGGFYDPDKLTAAVAREIGDFKPDVIFAPDPDVKSECHPDHRHVGQTAKTLALFANNPGIMARFGAEDVPVQALAFYMTADANRYVDTSGYLDRQFAAIFDCHRSQFPSDCDAGKCDAGKAVRLYLKLRAVDFGLRSLHRTAEGFRVLGRTQMHCLPEAGL